MNKQWQQLKETITELRDNDGTGTPQELCKFLVNYMNILEKKMQEPCGDCISRAEAIASLGEEPYVWNDDFDELAVREQWRDYVKVLKDLPSVQPKSKTDVFDKIRAEIRTMVNNIDTIDGALYIIATIADVLDIIDKYRSESEE